MYTVTISEQGGVQSIQFPPGIRLNTPLASIRQEGDRVVIEPVKSSKWPEGFFEAFQSGDVDIERPPQGQLPPIKDLQ